LLHAEPFQVEDNVEVDLNRALKYSMEGKILQDNSAHLPVQLVKPRVESGYLILQTSNLGFVVVRTLGNTHGFAGERGEIRFMPITVHPDLPLLDIRISLALLVGQITQLFVHDFGTREHLSGFA
jgi:hypothetical protein